MNQSHIREFAYRCTQGLRNEYKVTLNVTQLLLQFLLTKRGCITRGYSRETASSSHSRRRALKKRYRMREANRGRH